MMEEEFRQSVGHAAHGSNVRCPSVPCGASGSGLPPTARPRHRIAGVNQQAKILRAGVWDVLKIDPHNENRAIVLPARFRRGLRMPRKIGASDGGFKNKS